MVWSSKKESKARFGSGRRGLFGASVDRSQNAGALRQSAYGGPSIPGVAFICVHLCSSVAKDLFPFHYQSLTELFENHGKKLIGQ